MANNSNNSGSNIVVGAVGSLSASGGGNDLWHECVAWLTRCQIIPPDHVANSPTAEIRVLALTLRDGVLLCNLVLYLDPTCMDPSDFTRRPQMAQVSTVFYFSSQNEHICNFTILNEFYCISRIHVHLLRSENEGCEISTIYM